MDTQEKKIDREERKARIRHAYENPSRVNVIPPKERKSHDPNAKQVVAPYCRVSTMNEEQAESYEIQPEDFLSMGRATPFAGERVTGKCKFTIAGGKIAWLSSSTEN